LAILSDGPASILIADDNPVLLQGLHRALASNGYTVQTADDGAAVLDLLARSPAPPDLLLLDVMMPKLSGLDVLQRLRGDPRWSGVPVVLVTAATDEALPTKAREGGAEDVLIKPFRLNELLSCIELYLRRAPKGASEVICDPPSA
jgi:DNA-binding response OmpR family regulator